ncbi:hypothetical protein SAPIO_CDS6258 [Scedosporium apiospermum]|uniref:Thioesterase domain-containing protein n=1 Tax=Pseudallescheria apiosperma TaxID=563466 RepID=A0A084G4C5_PSEDA|nr:uncharacterized protein SAPIO_CDS6258 [Scedosporium apiospermum]KEZ42187.1 hypothetical protein SAPIO_CDS6258 [Scedosporium apiospermum]
MTTKLAPGPFVRAVWRSFMVDSGLEGRLLGEHFRIKEAAAGKVTFELDIKRQHTNRLGTLHGGCIASMVDLGGSLAVASMGRFATGVSTDINVSYISVAGRVGDTVTGTATCEKIGKTLAYTMVHFWNSKGELAARGSHTKYVAGTLTPEKPEYAAPNQFVDKTDK